MRSFALRGLIGSCAALLTAPALASFHETQIQQVIAGVNGDTSVQAIQLRARAGFQNFVSQGQVKVADATGANLIVILDLTQNVTNGNTGDTVLIASSNFVNFTNPPAVPDFTMTATIPDSYMAAGTL